MATQLLVALQKLPFSLALLISGVALVAISCVTIDKDYRWVTHEPQPFLLIGVGAALIVASLITHAFDLTSKSKPQGDEFSARLGQAQLKEKDGVLWTAVGGCDIRVTYGRIEEYSHKADQVVVLPCNEYFDDRCVDDRRSALGAYSNRAFDGRVNEFVSLLKNECSKKWGSGTQQQKTDRELAESFGAGRCLLLVKPLGHSVPIALLSTTTQRAGEGLSSQISYLFKGMHELVKCLADERINEVVMPLLGTGHGRIDPALALVGLLIAVAEAARYGQGGQRLRKVTIVVLEDAERGPMVDQIVIRMALALIASRG